VLSQRKLNDRLKIEKKREHEGTDNSSNDTTTTKNNNMAQNK